MERLLEFVAGEWGVVSQAPLTFAILAAMMFGASYLWHRERIKKLTEQKQLRDDDIAYLKSQTGSADIRKMADCLSGMEERLKAAENLASEAMKIANEPSNINFVKVPRKT